MKLAIFSDVHGNLEALEAVLEDMEAQAATHFICLGDIVGYNASPVECLHLIQALRCPVVRGNHDDMAGSDLPLTTASPNVAASIEFTRQLLSPAEKAYLQSLPYVWEQHHLQFVHASLEQPADWTYIQEIRHAEACFSHLKSRVCFFGHTHLPHAYCGPGGTQRFLFRTLLVKVGLRYLINPGSVGQPRDGDWRASYILYDLEREHIQLRRVSYDIAKATAKIRAAGLPEALASRLFIGS